MHQPNIDVFSGIDLYTNWMRESLRIEYRQQCKASMQYSELDPFVWNLVGHCGSYFESGSLQYRAAFKFSSSHLS